MTKLDHKDFKQINNLIEITNSLDVLYQKLADLEINGQKDTDAYQNLLEYLKVAVEVEKQAYEDCNLASSKGIAWVRYLLNNRLSSPFEGNLESILKPNDNDRIIKRIINILIHKVFANPEAIKDIYPGIMLQILEELENDGYDKYVPLDISDNYLIHDALYNDVLSCFLTFLNEFIKDPRFSDYQADLIKTKYNVAFSNQNIESAMLFSGFADSKDLYVNSQVVAQMADIDFYETLASSYGEITCLKQIAKIIDLSDADYQKKTNSKVSILRICLMQAALVLIDASALEEFDDNFHKFLENTKYVSEYTMSKHIILSIFEKSQKDKEKVRTFSLW